MGPYQDKVHREKCLLPTPEQSPILTTSNTTRQQQKTPFGLPILQNSADQIVDLTALVGSNNPEDRKKRKETSDLKEEIKNIFDSKVAKESIEVSENQKLFKRNVKKSQESRQKILEHLNLNSVRSVKTIKLKGYTIRRK